MTNRYQVWQVATAEELEQAEQIRQRIGDIDKDKRRSISTLWLNHFRSVRDFRLYLFRHGGKYTSLMERIRWFLGKQTIGGKSLKKWEDV